MATFLAFNDTEANLFIERLSQRELNVQRSTTGPLSRRLWSSQFLITKNIH